MAYNRTFNPDSLPAFAEPERKQGAPPPPQAPPSHSQTPPLQHHNSHHAQQHHSAAQEAAYAQQYGNRPQPSLPRPDQRQQGRDPRRLSPQMQPSANYGYGGSPPASSHGGYGGQSQSTSASGYAAASGHGRPPPAQQRPPPVSRPPPSPAPPNGADPALWPLFKAVDKDGRDPSPDYSVCISNLSVGSGQLSETELRAALVNGDWTAFDPHTVKMMIRMFDSDRSGLIGFEEFCGLWGFLAAWRSLFDRFDADRSGNISLGEYTNALDLRQEK
ncbi:EF-hand [Glarea lozoyensis ATCC 20868]|uniref:EF-hand n=1 Tax=Glarea lozoyensis (strain ATCC 20868 / MF5171) TaxID=1116229 RepID=S3D559_GLAL2|nr:EF-hand [Glarea lozoyensis ATCC 20868]EPE27206.1 EF-hand [Glarea lozoyensis ATCC 20868]